MSLIKPLFIILCAFSALAGCVHPEEISTADIDPMGWHGGDHVTIGVENIDTLSVRSLNLLFRFDNTFPKKNIPLKIKVTTPDSLWYEENFTAIPANTIKTNNDFYEALVPYRNGVILLRKGRYAFEISNAGEEVCGIWGIGMIIE